MLHQEPLKHTLCVFVRCQQLCQSRFFHDDNPLSVTEWFDEYEKAVTHVLSSSHSSNIESLEHIWEILYL